MIKKGSCYPFCSITYGEKKDLSKLSLLNWSDSVHSSELSRVPAEVTKNYFAGLQWTKTA